MNLIDYSEVFLPQNASTLRQFAMTAIQGFLEQKLSEIDRVKGDRSDRDLPSYGNIPFGEGEFQTFGDMIRAGIVVNIDGVAFFPHASDSAEVQACYRERRKSGDSHESAIFYAFGREAAKEYFGE